MYVAVFFASTQLLGTALSNFVGGMLMDGPLIALEALKLKAVGYDMTRYDYLFLLSSLLRMGCVLALLPFLRAQTETPAHEMWRVLRQDFTQKHRMLRHRLWVKRIRAKYRKENDPPEEE
jgi:hypothetical protein